MKDMVRAGVMRLQAYEGWGFKTGEGAGEDRRFS